MHFKNAKKGLCLKSTKKDNFWQKSVKDEHRLKNSNVLIVFLGECVCVCVCVWGGGE